MTEIPNRRILTRRGLLKLGLAGILVPKFARGYPLPGAQPPTLFVTPVKTADYSATVFDELVRVSIAAQSLKVTLPSASIYQVVQRFTVKCVDGSNSNRCTIATSGSDTIVTDKVSGVGSFKIGMTAILCSVTLESDGFSVWEVIDLIGNTS
jgi:hypothetical protein